MSSELIAIYTAVAAWAPVYKSGGTVKVWNLANLRSTGVELETPLRILAVETGDTSGEELNFVELGKMVAVTWSILDLFLLRLVTETPRHRANVDTEMMHYQVSYLDALAADRTPTAHSEIIDASMTPGVYEWPEGSGRFYHGVKCVISIREYVA